MKTINITEAINLARQNESLEGFAINDLTETQIMAKDALLLARHGVLVPEWNIYYRDEDVKYDSEFDDYEWTQLPKGITIDQLSDIAENYQPTQTSKLNIEIELDDEDALNWARTNYPVLKKLFNHVFRGVYASKTILETRKS